MKHEVGFEMRRELMVAHAESEAVKIPQIKWVCELYFYLIRKMGDAFFCLVVRRQNSVVRWRS